MQTAVHLKGSFLKTPLWCILLVGFNFSLRFFEKVRSIEFLLLMLLVF